MTTPPPTIEAVLAAIGPCVVACSGGIDSMLLACVAHRLAPETTVIAHAVSPAVPAEATQRVHDYAAREGWALRIVRSGEFADENYLANPVHRCYFCKSNLYESLAAIAQGMAGAGTIVSGTNVDDLGEYRPGLNAAAERHVRHPWVEAGYAKEDIRARARSLGLSIAELPASPCLASRLYSGTRVTPTRLAAVEAAEALVRSRTGLGVVRCRVRGETMLIETPAEGRARITPSLLEEVARLVTNLTPEIAGVQLDDKPYQPGRAFTVPA